MPAPSASGSSTVSADERTESRVAPARRDVLCELVLEAVGHGAARKAAAAAAIASAGLRQRAGRAGPRAERPEEVRCHRERRRNGQPIAA